MFPVISVFFFWILTLSAKADHIRIAVLEFKSISDLEQTFLLQLSDETRGGALDIFAPSRSSFSILTRENILDVLEKDGKDSSCLQESCAISLGRSINSRFIVSGDISFLEKKYILYLSLYDTESGMLLKKDSVTADSRLNLLEKIRSFSKKFFTDNLKKYDLGIEKTNRIGESNAFVVPTTKNIIYIDSEAKYDIQVLWDGTQKCSSIPCSFIGIRGEHTLELSGKGCSAVRKKFSLNQTTSFTTNDSEIDSLDMKCDYGVVNITSSTEGKVSIHDKQLPTPVQDVILPIGNYDLVFSSLCFQEYRNSIQVSSLQRTSFDISQLQEKMVQLEVSAFKQNGTKVSPQIFVDGKEYSSSTIQIPYCAQKLVLKNSTDTIEHNLQLYKPEVADLEKKLLHKKIIVEPEKSFRLEIPMEHYTKRDVEEAKKKYSFHNSIDLGLAGLGILSAGFGGFQISHAIAMFEEGNSITNSNLGQDYDKILAEGENAINMGTAGFIVSATSITSAIIHWMKITKSKKKKYQYLQLVTK